MSAFGPKRTWPRALHMSAFGGKADMTVCGCLLLQSLSGVKRTCVAALHESAFDPKRTFGGVGERAGRTPGAGARAGESHDTTRDLLEADNTISAAALN